MQAGSVLWYTDDDQGTNVIPGGITLAGHTGTQATSSSDFNTQLSSSTWDAVIIGEQSDSLWSSVSAGLTTYLAGGGKIIGATWRSDGMSLFFDATVMATNQSPITTNAHAIWASLPSTVSFTNPGWGTYSQTYSPNGTAVGTGAVGGGYGAIIGNDGNTILNAALFDSYANATEGERLVANELNYLIDDSAGVPEPGSWSLLAGGLAAVAVKMRRRK
jgi:hypothetical protein